MADETQGFTIRGDAVRRTFNVVREVETNLRVDPAQPRRSKQPLPLVEGILIDALAGTDDPNAPTSATFQIKTALRDLDTWANVNAPSIITVWNRTPTSYPAEFVGFAKEMYVGKWYLLPGAGGGTHEIWFTIISVECVSATEMILTVQPTWYTGGCAAAIPGEDSYGYVEVEDVCEILLFYTATWLVGKTGRATYMYPRTGYCTPKWIVDTICGTPECQ